MGIFKRRENKKFGYDPRFYENDGKGSPYEVKPRFEEYREDLSPKGLTNKFKHAWSDYHGNKDKSANRRVFYIALFLVLIFLYIIDFDLSIFL